MENNWIIIWFSLENNYNFYKKLNIIMISEYKKIINDFYLKWKFIIQTKDFPNKYSIQTLEKQWLIFSFKQWWYLILVKWRSKSWAIDLYFFDIIKKVLDNRYWINWYIADESAKKIKNKKPVWNKITIRAKNWKSTIFEIISIKWFKTKIMARTDNNIKSEIFKEFRWMRIKFENNKKQWLNISELKSLNSIKENKNNNQNLIYKIIITNIICNFEDIEYETEDKMTNNEILNILDKLSKNKKIFIHINNWNKFYSLLKTISTPKTLKNLLFNNSSKYFESKERQDKMDNSKKILTTKKNKTHWNKIFSQDYKIWELENILEELKIEYSESYLKKAKLDMVFKSAELEWFWWTYADTKKLIEENIQPLWMKDKDKQILLNIRDSFDLMVKTKWNTDLVEINSLIQKWITDKEYLWIRREWINVEIRKSIYRPIKWNDIQNWWFLELKNEIEKIENPINQAFAALMLISFVQSFYDWNKRTARMFCNSILFKNNLPLINFSWIEKMNYDKNIVYFYETWNFDLFKIIFIKEILKGKIES